MRDRSRHDRANGVEGVEHRVEFGIERRKRIEIREGEFEVRPGEPELTAAEALGQHGTIAQITNGSEVDSGVAGVAYLVEDLFSVGDVGVDADREFKRSVADRRIRHCDFHNWSSFIT